MAYIRLINIVFAVTLGCMGTQAFAKNNHNNHNVVTLIEMGDLHGTLVPHAAIMKNLDGSEYEAPSAGVLHA